MDKIKKYIRRNKKLTFVAIGLMVLSLPFIVNQVLKRQDLRQRAQVAPSISFSFSPQTRNVAVGSRFDVDLIMNAGVNDIGSLEFTINYPSDKLTLISDTPNSVYTVADKQSTAGSYKVTLLNITSTPVTGNGIKVVTFTFEGEANGLAKVKLDPATLQVTASGSDQFVPVDNPNLIEGNYAVGAGGGATLSFSPNSGSHNIGSIFSVEVRLNAVETVNAVEFDIPFPIELTVTSITKGAFDIEASKTVTGGVINLAYGSITPLTGNLLVATINFRANLAGTANLAFTNAQALSDITNTNVLTGSTGGTYTLTGTSITPTVSPTLQPSPTPTRTPTPTNTPSPTPTRTPTPTPTRTPTPTPTSTPSPTPTRTPTPTLTSTPTPTNTPTPTPTVPPLQTRVAVAVTLPGIGLGVGDNTTPTSINRTASIEIFNALNVSVANVTGTLTYVPSTGRYQGSIDLGSSFVTGTYLANVKLPNTLAKRIPGILTFTTGLTTNTTPVTMISGDLGNDNSLDILDWTNMVACNRGETACTTAIRAQSDLNDDGAVNTKDATIMQRGFINREGD